MAVNVKVTGDNSGLKTAINESKASLKDLVADFSRKTTELNRLGSKLGETQRKLVLGTNSASYTRGVENVLAKLNSQINTANGLYRLNGDRLEMVKAKSQAFQTALTELYQRGMQPGSKEAVELENKIRRLNDAISNIEAPKRAAEEQRKLAEAEAKSAEAARKAAEVRKRAYSDLVNMTKSVGRNLTMSVTLPMAAITGAALKAYGQLDSLRRGLAVVEGSMADAMRRQKELKQVYQLPGLGIAEALRGDVLLRQAGGYSSKQSMEIMKQFGNAVALGGGGKEQFGLVLMQLTQMSSKSKVLAEDLKPLINQAPVAAAAIRKLFGTVDSEQISAKLQAAGKGPREFISMLTAELAKADRVSSGFRNGWENLTDSLMVAGDTLGRVIDQNGLLTDTLSIAGQKVEALAAWFEGLSEAEQVTYLSILAFVASVGPAVYITGTLAASVQNLVQAKQLLTTVIGAERMAMIASIGPYAALAAAAVLAGAGLYSLYKTYNPTIVSAKQLADVTATVTKETAGELAKVKELVAIAGDDKKAKEERAKALNQLKNQYPDYFSKMDIERVKVGDLKKSYDDLSNSIIKTARSRAAEAKIQENEAKILELTAENHAQYQKTASDRRTQEFLRPGSNLTMGGMLNQTRADASFSLSVQEMKNRNQQITQLRTANNLLSEFVQTKKEEKEVITPTQGDLDRGKERNDDTAEALKLLADLRDVQSQESKGRRTLNNIVSDGYQERVRIIRMNINEELRLSLIIASRAAQERKLAEARQKMAISMLRGVYQSPFDWNPQARLADKGKQLGASIRKNSGKGGDAPYSGLDGFSEIERAIARAYAIDLSKPLNSWNQQLMTGLTQINQTLRQGAVDAFVGMGEVIGAMVAGSAGIEDLPKMLLGVVGGMFQEMGRAYIVFGTQTALASSLLTNFATAPVAAIALGVALTALGAGLKGAMSGGSKTKAFAEGGIAYGRVFGNNAVAGEYSNVRTNPEVIAPLNRLTDILRPHFMAAVRMGQVATIPAAKESNIQITITQNARGQFEAMDAEKRRLAIINGR